MTKKTGTHDTEQAITLKSEPPTIDTGTLANLTNDVGEEVVSLTIEAVLQDLKERGTLLLKAIKTSDYQQCAYQAHALKSGCATVGFLAMAKYLEELEAQAKSDTPDLSKTQNAFLRYRKKLASKALSVLADLK